MQSLGSCSAILYKIQTLADGGARITLDVGQESNKLIAELLKQYLNNKPLVEVGFVGAQ